MKRLAIVLTVMGLGVYLMLQEKGKKKKKNKENACLTERN